MLFQTHVDRRDEEDERCVIVSILSDALEQPELMEVAAEGHFMCHMC